MNYVFSLSSQIWSQEYYLPYLLSTLIAYGQYCMKHEEVKEDKRAFDAIPELVTTNSTALYQVLAAYCQAQLADDQAKAEEIKKILELTRYTNYLDM
ncbi:MULTISPECIES: hypothetical protein [Lactobacillus]|uniref:Uncharacterized protein n=1 Tax=Lactobacillus xujianguonis TaxID=2495899 RepID=A0A437SSM9_9LACO|nr:MULTISPECIES: hypothetical protein [Lactobacillus]RVU69874.1 hypothetical protein EJK17_10740 [Lactobacillus xujianguonis]RVU73861.1 hypothetical protein EJK20_05755 [Lactobacillus xujianguonis]